jgi:hypothetical protein
MIKHVRFLPIFIVLVFKWLQLYFFLRKVSIILHRPILKILIINRQQICQQNKIQQIPSLPKYVYFKFMLPEFRLRPRQVSTTLHRPIFTIQLLFLQQVCQLTELQQATFRYRFSMFLF